MSTTHTAQPSVVFFGMTGRFSAPPLRALLRAEIAVRAVVLPALTAAAPPITPVVAPVGRAAGRRALPLVGAPNQPNILELAHAAGIPTYEAGSLVAPETLALLDGLAPDAFCIACFNRRFPAALLALPRLGCLNVHPSLLPDNRGPDPLFWTFRRGDHETGVTVHLMDERLDSGPILLQEKVPVPEGIAEAALERECAEPGGALLVRALYGLADGTLTPMLQDASRATSYPLPDLDDFTIMPDWSARLAYTFAAGIVGREQPARVAAGGAMFRVIAPLNYDAESTLDAPYRLEGEVLTLRCAPGIFTARVARQEG